MRLGIWRQWTSQIHLMETLISNAISRSIVGCHQMHCGMSHNALHDVQRLEMVDIGKQTERTRSLPRSTLKPLFTLVPDIFDTMFTVWWLRAMAALTRRRQRAWCGFNYHPTNTSSEHSFTIALVTTMYIYNSDKLKTCGVHYIKGFLHIYQVPSHTGLWHLSIPHFTPSNLTNSLILNVW